MTKRDKVKNPALKKQFNLKSRQELLDFDYLDQLSEEEAEFLNTFVSETVNTNFLHDEELKRLNDLKSEIINCPGVREYSDRIKTYKIDLSEAPNDDLKRQIKNRIEELGEKKRKLIRKNKTANEAVLLELDKQIAARREAVLLFPKKKQHKQFYDENNSRNRDLYNKAMRTNSLLQLEPEHFDNVMPKSSVDYEMKQLDAMECAELECQEARVYQMLLSLDCVEAKLWVKKLDKCKSHGELYFLLEEIENWMEERE